MTWECSIAIEHLKLYWICLQHLPTIQYCWLPPYHTIILNCLIVNILIPPIHNYISSCIPCIISNRNALETDIHIWYQFYIPAIPFLFLYQHTTKCYLLVQVDVFYCVVRSASVQKVWDGSAVCVCHQDCHHLTSLPSWWGCGTSCEAAHGHLCPTSPFQWSPPSAYIQTNIANNWQVSHVRPNFQGFPQSGHVTVIQFHQICKNLSWYFRNQSGSIDIAFEHKLIVWKLSVLTDQENSLTMPKPLIWIKTSMSRFQVESRTLWAILSKWRISKKYWNFSVFQNCNNGVLHESLQ